MSADRPVEPARGTTRARMTAGGGREKAQGARLQGVRLVRTVGGRQVLAGVDIEARPGELLTLIGRAGSGKSSLLRLLAGLESPAAGDIFLDGAPAALPCDRVRMVFEAPRLLPWKTVGENVALGLPVDCQDPALAIAETLQEVGLGSRGAERPDGLAADELQQVALARALVGRPSVLLLDEPFGALDSLTRLDLQALFARIWRASGFTAILATSDIDEALALGDRVLVLAEGRVTLSLPVLLPRPRSRTSPGYSPLYSRIVEQLAAGGRATRSP